MSLAIDKAIYKLMVFYLNKKSKYRDSKLKKK